MQSIQILSVPVRFNGVATVIVPGKLSPQAAQNLAEKLVCAQIQAEIDSSPGNEVQVAACESFENEVSSELSTEDAQDAWDKSRIDGVCGAWVAQADAPDQAGLAAIENASLPTPSPSRQQLITIPNVHKFGDGQKHPYKHGGEVPPTTFDQYQQWEPAKAPLNQDPQPQGPDHQSSETPLRECKPLQVAPTLQFEPHANEPKPWGAVGVFGDKYWAADNGNWDSDPDNSGPNSQEAKEHQDKENEKVLGALSSDARRILMKFHPDYVVIGNGGYYSFREGKEVATQTAGDSVPTAE